MDRCLLSIGLREAILIGEWAMGGVSVVSLLDWVDREYSVDSDWVDTNRILIIEYLMNSMHWERSVRTVASMGNFAV